MVQVSLIFFHCIFLEERAVDAGRGVILEVVFVRFLLLTPSMIFSIKKLGSLSNTGGKQN